MQLRRRHRGRFGLALSTAGLLAFLACGDGTAADAVAREAGPQPRQQDASASDGAALDGTSACAALEPKACSGEAQLERCNASGTGSERIECPLGCTGGTAPRCRSFRPHEPVLPEDLRLAELADVTFSASLEINTDTGAISGVRAGNVSFDRQEIRAGIGFRAEPRTGVFVFGKLSIPAGVTVRVHGERALALVSTSDLELAGVIDARPYRDDELCAVGSHGAGGFAGGRPNGPDTQGHGEGRGGGDRAPVFGLLDAYGGGGGAGHGERGGAGARATFAETYVAGGAGGLAQALLYPVTGGGGGGSGAATARGGGGGGGVHLVAAARCKVGSVDAVPAGINVSGCGGQAGGPAKASSPGGGGAGGAILLEAAVLEMGAHVAFVANGGGGGGGTVGAVSGFEAGPVAGGEATAGSFGRGGEGGWQKRPIGETPPNPPIDTSGGGGGGGIGTLSFFDSDGVLDLPADALLSPAFETLDDNGLASLCVSGAVVPLD